jgi:hypothetical protein
MLVSGREEMGTFRGLIPLYKVLSYAPDVFPVICKSQNISRLEALCSLPLWHFVSVGGNRLPGWERE